MLSVDIAHIARQGLRRHASTHHLHGGVGILVQTHIASAVEWTSTCRRALACRVNCLGGNGIVLISVDLVTGKTLVQQRRLRDFQNTPSMLEDIYWAQLDGGTILSCGVAVRYQTWART
eukprot:5687092-Amphidinium_carterae.1